jgi:N-acetyl sugar amidotransferase
MGIESRDIRMQVIERGGKRYLVDPKEGLLEVKYGLPAEVKYCARCVISNQRPSSTIEFHNRPDSKKETIAFGEEGVCVACRYADLKEKEIDWKEREQELVKLCNRFRSRNGSYDCIVPGSGGKDSCFTSHMLKFRFGMNPLTVTWAPHRYSDIGWKNLQSWIHAGFDNLLYTPNGKAHRLLTRLAFENLVHPFQPFILGQRLTGPRFSVLFDVPLVFYGENQAEYGNNIADNFKPTMSMEFFTACRDPEAYVLGGVPVPELIGRYGFDRRDLNPYLPVDAMRLKDVGTEVHYLSYYVKWDPQECYYYASEHCGFQANSARTEGSYSKYSSIDDRIDPLHYYTTLIKFGIGRATYDAAQEIRNGKITREEGVALVRRFDEEFPGKYFREILDYMGIDESRFWGVVEQARSPHLWRRTDEEWVLRHPIQ